MAFEKPTSEELEQRFLFHPVKGNQGDYYEAVRNKICKLAKELVAVTPCCPEQTRAVNSLDEAMFLFCASIARHT